MTTNPGNFGLERTRIVLADDHPLMRQALRIWIEKQQDLEIVAEANDGREAVEIAGKLHPHMVILGVSVSLSGLEATRQILAMNPDTRILVITFHPDNEYIQNITRAGARGYLTRKASGEEIISAIRTIAAGGQVFPPLPPASRNHERMPLNKPDELNTREMTILKLIASGLSNKEISFRLGLSVPWVKANLTNLFLKLGANSRTEAISIGLKSGILTLDDLSE